MLLIIQYIQSLFNVCWQLFFVHKLTHTTLARGSQGARRNLDLTFSIFKDLRIWQ